MLVLFFLRFCDMYYWEKNLKGHTYNAAKPMLRFEINRYLTALSFSTYSIIFYDYMDVNELAFTIIILSSMAGGGATILAANKGLVLSYPLVLLIPISILCLFSSDNYQNILGVLGFVFSAITFFSGTRSYQFTSESILIKNKHADLLDEMELANQKVLEVNLNLEKGIKERTEQLLELSNIDPLTNLFNRTAFSKSLKLLIDSGKMYEKKLAVLFIDLDGFKNINDSHGHAVGDKVLVEIAKRLRFFSKEQKYLCRWGGDEFLITLPENHAVEAHQFARQLIALLSKPIIIEHHEVVIIGATIGIAMYPDHGTSGADLIALADTAMYIQKQTAKADVCVFTEKIREKLHRDKKLKEGLDQALKNDELFIVFQPVIDSRSNKVGFCEALLRWELNGESISPNEFIPIAELHGLIHSIGSWVLRESCHIAANWTFDDSVDIAVNVSVEQVMQGDLVLIVKGALDSSGLPAKKLHIEITESIFIDNIDYVLEQMKTLQMLGIKISIDDFGTGFSSLSLLQSLSADIVKIDRTFISSIDKGGKAIIQATQYMAGELGYTVVAEGIENKEQADILSDMGIESLQGFYFSKPMKADKLAAWHIGFMSLGIE